MTPPLCYSIACYSCSTLKIAISCRSAIPRYDDYALRPLRLDVGQRVTNGDPFSASAARIWSHVSDLFSDHR